MATKVVNGIEVEMTQQEIDDIAIQNAALAAEVSANLYATNRQFALDGYLSIVEQLDMIWHCIDNEQPLDQTSEFYLHRKAVKDTYPKPE